MQGAGHRLTGARLLTRCGAHCRTSPSTGTAPSSSACVSSKTWHPCKPTKSMPSAGSARSLRCLPWDSGTSEQLLGSFRKPLLLSPAASCQLPALSPFLPAQVQQRTFRERFQQEAPFSYTDPHPYRSLYKVRLPGPPLAPGTGCCCTAELARGSRSGSSSQPNRKGLTPWLKQFPRPHHAAAETEPSLL